MCICKTKYPILLVHGTGFRDRKHFGYWGRIPKALEAHGATIVYGNQDSWGTIEHNSGILRRNLLAYVKETGGGKVNIIAHSKGGLEARYLASSLNCSDRIASITTISTPHHGSVVMDIVLRLPSALLQLLSVFINLWFRLLGDEKPDFFHTCQQFTTGYMEKFNILNPDADGVYYQSFATVMKSPFSDLFMFLPYLFVRLAEGKNDGLVTVSSAAWTNFKGVWEGASLRGISHADAVDLRRRKFCKRRTGSGVSDICNCYIELVKDLKRDGF